MFIQQWAIDPGQCSKTKIYESKSTSKEETKLSLPCKMSMEKIIKLY